MTDAWVLDASIAIRWVLDDQARPQTDDLLARASVDDVHVPDIWRYEVAQVVVRQHRECGRAGYRALEFANRLYGLALRVDQPLTWSRVLHCIGWSTGLGVKLPDAVYVDLAYRRGLPLATLDRKQAEAAKQPGVRIIWPLPDLA